MTKQPEVANFFGLQWGRDQLIAEFRGTVAAEASRAALQWGRDQLIAELGIKAYCAWKIRGFNGAAIS